MISIFTPLEMLGRLQMRLIFVITFSSINDNRLSIAKRIFPSKKDENKENKLETRNVNI